MTDSTTELWKIHRGIIMAYTNDPRIIRNIQRTTRRSQRWKVFAQYFKNGKRIAVQYKIPRTDRKQAEKVFNVEVNEK